MNEELIRKSDAIAIAEAWEDAAIGNRDMETAVTAQHIASAIFALEPVVVDG